MIEMTNEDKDLQDIFHGEEKPMHPDTVYMTIGGSQKPASKPNSQNESNVTSKEEKPVQAQWEPAKPAPNYMDKLRTMAKNVSVYAVLSVILFWWQQSGRLEVTTSWYALLVCVGMMFFSIGRAWNGGCK